MTDKNKEWRLPCSSGRADDDLVIEVYDVDVNNGAATLRMREANALDFEATDDFDPDAETHITATPDGLRDLAAMALEAASEVEARVYARRIKELERRISEYDRKLGDLRIAAQGWEQASIKPAVYQWLIRKIDGLRE